MFQILYNLLGETLARMKKYEEAELWYKKALKAKPDHVPTHLTYGKLLAKNVNCLAFKFKSLRSYRYYK